MSKQEDKIKLFAAATILTFVVGFGLWTWQQNRLAFEAVARTDPYARVITVTDDKAKLIELAKLSQDILVDAKDSSSTTMAIYFEDLNSGAFAAVNEQSSFISASMYKLFVGYVTLDRIDAGQLSLTQATGFDAGSMTIEDCLHIMITVSDNPCGRALRKVLNVSSGNPAELDVYGLQGTNLSGDYPTTTAVDIATLYRRLYTQADLSPELNEFYLDLLKSQQIVNRLPQGLPSNITIAHKTGDLEGYYHDGGIIYTDAGNYILVVLSGPLKTSESGLFSQFAAVSKAVFDLYAP